MMMMRCLSSMTLKDMPPSDQMLSSAMAVMGPTPVRLFGVSIAVCLSAGLLRRFAPHAEERGSSAFSRRVRSYCFPRLG